MTKTKTIALVGLLLAAAPAYGAETDPTPEQIAAGVARPHHAALPGARQSEAEFMSSIEYRRAEIAGIIMSYRDGVAVFSDGNRVVDADAEGRADFSRSTNAFDGQPAFCGYLNDPGATPPRMLCAVVAKDGFVRDLQIND